MISTKTDDTEVARSHSVFLQPEKSSKAIGIIYHRLNYLTIGSIIAVAQKYVDRVYVIVNNDDHRVAEISRSMGAEVIEKSENPYIRLFRRLTLENNAGIMVAMYGDGTHDPGKIPELIENVRDDYDASIGPSSIVYTHYVNETVLYLNNKMLKNVYPGILVCSSRCFEKLNKDFILDIKSDLPQQLVTKIENIGLKVKRLDTVEKENYDIFSLYRIAVVVPAYNEELLIGDTLNSIPSYVCRIYVIDDGSKDKTWDIINSFKDSRIVAIKHEVNKGVGSSIVTGYKKALEDNMDIVAVMAGDNQMDPEQLPRLLLPIIDGRADYTKGNRLLNKDFRTGMSKWRSFGNFLLTMLTKIASGYWHVMDPQNGYAAISRQALEALDLDAVYTYYGYCNDLLVKLNTYGMRTVDVVMPSRYGRERSKIKYSKYIRKVSPMLLRGFLWRLKTKYILLDFNPLVLFYAASMIMVPFGVLFSLWILIEKTIHGSVSTNYPLLSAFITLTGLQFLMFAMLFDMQADKSRS